ncbi:hypothetical protein OV207_14345 [Corallococcus sp. BB11-1]|uniref:hypothetical protein n=1 Tax=Corallococcus sp. BB11-1 TaxID=2996783 RepID=UPI00226FEEFD|nr:hypothetical protein [Corallococcus sp. BB11-1]MCY1032647.1 hypothetical protein [Corallococcus sp. BB11-1]
MRTRLIPLVFGLALLSAACGDTTSLERDTGSASAEAVAESESSLTTYRYCASSLDCAGACMCSANQCVPDGFGPPNPDCGAPPQRECSTGADCRDSCICSAGFCAPDGFSPPSPFCHLPPPDAYEDNDTAAQFTAYPGSPLTGLNFHELGDVDWFAVYFGGAMTAKFETYIVQGADTFLEVYAHSNGGPGALVASNNDICSVWYDLSCKASRVTLSVPANSAYYVRIRNLNDGAHNVYNQTPPRYNFRIY